MHRNAKSTCRDVFCVIVALSHYIQHVPIYNIMLIGYKFGSLSISTKINRIIIVMIEAVGQQLWVSNL